jgi:hypothetical protein
MSGCTAQVHKDVASMQQIRAMLREEILKFLLGIIVIIRRKFERKIRSGPECGQGVPAIGNLRRMFCRWCELFDCAPASLRSACPVV